MRNMALIFILIFFSTASSAEDVGWCEDVVEVESYQTRFGSLDVVFPRYLEILVDGRPVVADGDPVGWLHPHSGLLIAEAGGYLLIEAYWQDCVDLLDRRIYLLSAAGELVVSSPIWASFWDDAFFFEGDALVYWSSWFCHAENGDRSEDRSYVYVWPGSGDFRREARALESICSEEGLAEIGRRRIAFTELEPDRSGNADP